MKTAYPWRNVGGCLGALRDLPGLEVVLWGWCAQPRKQAWPNQRCGCGCGERDSSVRASFYGAAELCTSLQLQAGKRKKKCASKAWLRRHAENFSHSSDFSRSPAANTLLLPLLCSKPPSKSQPSGFSSAARPCRCGGHGLPPAGRPPHGAPRPSRRIGFVPPSGGAAILPCPGRGAAPGSQI